MHNDLHTKMHTNNNKNKLINNSSSSSIAKIYEENIGMLTPLNYELLDSFKEDFNDELIEEAIKIASNSNKRNMNYIKGILNQWKSKGYSTLLDIQEEKAPTPIYRFEKKRDITIEDLDEMRRQRDERMRLREKEELK